MTATNSAVSGQPSSDRHALAADGTMLRLAPPTAGDEPAIRALFDRLSSDSMHMRFFGGSRRAAAETARRICRTLPAEGGALLAWRGELVVGAAEFYVIAPGEAEIAVTVAEDWHTAASGRC